MRWVGLLALLSLLRPSPDNIGGVCCLMYLSSVIDRSSLQSTRGVSKTFNPNRTSSHAKIGFSPRAPRLAVVAVNRTSRPPQAQPQPPSIMCIQRQGVTRIWPPLRR